MGPKLDQNLVRQVSRSFSLTLLSLPSSHRAAVAYTYLLARYADTLVDAGTWPEAERMSHLSLWEKSILQKDGAIWELKGSVGGFKPEEAAFLLRGQELLQAYFSLSAPELFAGDEVLKTLFGAMKWDLETFVRKGGESTEGGGSGVAQGCRDEKYFDWYCYSIAGCVGRYWVQVFGLPQDLEHFAVSYGKALQRINILRDAIEDWERGRLYLPTTALENFNIQPTEKPWLQNGWHAFEAQYIRETRELLKFGGFFCDALPRSGWRLRWASSMPLLIGIETLSAIEKCGLARSSSKEKIKISRREVKKLAFRNLLDTLLGRKLSGRVQAMTTAKARAEERA